MTDLTTIQANEAQVNITWSGQNGDLPDPVAYDAPNGDVLQWAAEAIRNGDVPGISADTNVNFADFVVDRFNAKDNEPNKIVIRPKTPFGV
jgi:hypothetical protein